MRRATANVFASRVALSFCFRNSVTKTYLCEYAAVIQAKMLFAAGSRQVKVLAVSHGDLSVGKNSP